LKVAGGLLALLLPLLAPILQIIAALKLTALLSILNVVA
jgi:hypothetical protein